MSRPVLTITSPSQRPRIQLTAYAYLPLTLPTAIRWFEIRRATTTARAQNLALPSTNLTSIRRANGHVLVTLRLAVSLKDLFIILRHYLPQRAIPLTLPRSPLDVHAEALAHLADLRPDSEDGKRHEPAAHALVRVVHREQEVRARREADAHAHRGRARERVLVFRQRDELLRGRERLLVVRVRGDGVALCDGCARRDVACVAVEVAGRVDEGVDDPECALSALVALADPEPAEVSGKHSMSEVGGDARWALLHT